MRARLALPAVLLLLALAAPAEAYRAKCIPGQAKSPTCTWQKAKVVFISDGDTVDVKLQGKPGVKHIRLTGINAMELQRYSKTPSKRRGDCHGLEATSLIEKQIKRANFRVRLAAQKQSSRSRNRLRRSVWVKTGGRLRDLAKMQLEAGQALWLPGKDEYAHNLEYAILASQAIIAGKNLYDPDFCGAGPDQDLPLTLALQWDADNNDGQNVNGEYVDIRNGGNRPLSLRKWLFRDSDLRREGGNAPPGYEFPASAIIPPGGAVRLRMGCGDDSVAVFHWCLKTPPFENVAEDGRDLGDGGYLYDPDRDLRASTMYPCVVACVDPLKGKIRLSVQPQGEESVAITNTSGAAVDLVDHALKLRNRGKKGEYVYSEVFGPGSVLDAGETYTYRPSRDRYENSGGVVELRTLTHITAACDDWGSGKC